MNVASASGPVYRSGGRGRDRRRCGQRAAMRAAAAACGKGNGRDGREHGEERLFAEQPIHGHHSSTAMAAERDIRGSKKIAAVVPGPNGDEPPQPARCGLRRQVSGSILLAVLGARADRRRRVRDHGHRRRRVAGLSQVVVDREVAAAGGRGLRRGRGRRREHAGAGSARSSRSGCTASRSRWSCVNVELKLCAYVPVKPASVNVWPPDEPVPPVVLSTKRSICRAAGRRDRPAASAGSSSFRWSPGRRGGDRLLVLREAGVVQT